MHIYLLGAFFLAWILGRNNLSNAFGNAISLRMLSLRWSAFLGALFLCIGMFSNSASTTTVVSNLGVLKNMQEPFMICTSAAIVLLLLTHLGLPVSISQLTIGAFTGLLFYYGRQIDTVSLLNIFFSWLISPFLSIITSYVCFQTLRYLFLKFKIPLLYRTTLARIGLIIVGCFSCYTIGANNVSSILGLYVQVSDVYTFSVIGGIGLMICLGFFMASPKVMHTMGRKLFPLTPLEAFSVILSCSLTLFVFSSVLLKDYLYNLGIILPTAPIPIAMVLVGSVIGISLSKGGYGIQFRVLNKIIISYFLSPFFSGIICCFFLYLQNIIEKYWL